MPGKKGTQKSASSASSSNTSPAPSEMGPEVTGSQKEYETFLPLAEAIPAKEVIPFRADGSLAYHNVTDGTNAVMAEAARLAAELPAVDPVLLAEMPRLALAVLFAAAQVDRGAPATPDKRALVASGTRLRDVLLAVATGLARAGIVPTREVEKIREGRGAIDVARDCVELSALFSRHAAAIRGKSPVTAAQVREAAEVGTRLLETLKPSAMKRNDAAGPALKAAMLRRDQLWTLLNRRWNDLWRCGAWLFGRAEVDRRVPALQARRAAAGKQKQRTPKIPAAPAKSPAATPTPA